MRRTLAVITLMGLLCTGARAQSPTPSPAVSTANVAVDDLWLSRFERSWGELGLYVRETPSAIDAHSRTRVNLQRLQDAAREFVRRNPGFEPSPTLMQAEGLVPELLPHAADERYTWDAATKRMVSTIGGTASLKESASIQLGQVTEVTRRFDESSALVTSRWKKLHEDPACPDVIRKEIEMRRAFEALWNPKPVREAALCQQNLSLIGHALAVYARQADKADGNSATMHDAASTGLLNQMTACPAKGRYSVQKIGEAPRCSVGGAHAYGAEAELGALRKASLEARLAAAPESAGALALLARFSDGKVAQEMLGRAVAMAPDVAALRLERIALSIRLGAEDAIAEDINWLLANFPAAPVLHGIDVATLRGGLEGDPEFRARIELKMADARPDLLFVQLRAILLAEEAGLIPEATRVYDRLLAQNPGYGDVLTRPAAH